MANQPIKTTSEKGNTYIDGSYRLWMDPNGAIRIKFDKADDIFYVSKKSDLYHDLKEKMFNK